MKYMKVPEYIKKAARDMAKYSVIVNKNDRIIRKWLLKNNLMNDGNLDALIDDCNLNNNPEGFIQHIENNSFEGNLNEYEREYNDEY